MMQLITNLPLIQLQAMPISIPPLKALVQKPARQSSQLNILTGLILLMHFMIIKCSGYRYQSLYDEYYISGISDFEDSIKIIKTYEYKEKVELDASNVNVKRDPFHYICFRYIK